mmetsp:Transcript_44401/g.108512  ORF Transcript_44401/g.108512 Transcript_44401/m.108512 type:complete len:278 (-) Transcript_44401:416-1249(-)
MLRRNIHATTPEIIPRPMKIGSSFSGSAVSCEKRSALTWNVSPPPRIALATSVERVAETKTAGAAALVTCLSSCSCTTEGCTISRAKTMAARGALKPAATPAAQPADTSTCATSIGNLRASDITRDRLAPISTAGPSGPRETPEPSVATAAVVLAAKRPLSRGVPVLISSITPLSPGPRLLYTSMIVLTSTPPSSGNKMYSKLTPAPNSSSFEGSSHGATVAACATTVSLCCVREFIDVSTDSETDLLTVSTDSDTDLLIEVERPTALRTTSAYQPS